MSQYGRRIEQPEDLLSPLTEDRRAACVADERTSPTLDAPAPPVTRACPRVALV